MSQGVFNFNAGPAVLPLDVLKEVQGQMLNYQETGMSILEISHRSKEYETINRRAEANLKELLGLGDTHRVLLLQGGASTQFAMIPMNLLTAGQTADYILTGAWSEKALKEAKLFGNTHVAATTAEGNYKRIPHRDEIQLSDKPAYVHITSNNTIFGTQWRQLPSFGKVPLIADMSSDILSKPFAAENFSLIYAGAQKNLGPSGVTVVIARKELLENNPKDIPTMMRYETHAKNDSLYNTPPAFSVYVLDLVLQWVKSQGGLAGMQKRNEEKAALIYDTIDQSGGFYIGHAEQDSRSLMNITFRLPSEEQEKTFVSQAEKAGLVGLKGHRSVGGLRASVYNAMTLEGCQALQQFMLHFQQNNG
jgi:phosphoserine aminotransferase